METDMTEMTLYGGLVAMLYLFAAISAFWAVLRWLDRLAGLEFRRGVMPVILETSPGAAFYFGARIIAVAIVVSAVLS
jgi:hypothetical protein